ncbi:hypothetical protein LL946_07910 [Knoellia locipacati]|uniref:hypothetical protein n=1 Tax=Knoellia locipacati TaxID=882824 RepID=UPI0038502041
MFHKRIRHSIGTLTGAGLAVAGLGLALAAPASAGVSGPAFYVDGTWYRTVATPTDLSGTGAPAHSFDTIYSLGVQPSIATAAPGDRDYNGGRWVVHAVSLPHGYAAALDSGDLDGDGVLTSDTELMAAMMAGDAVDAGAVKYFVCTVNKLPAGQR